MSDQGLPFIGHAQGARRVHAVRPAGLEAWLAGLPAAQAAFLRGSLFTAKAQEVRLLPGPEGVEGAVLGLGQERGPHGFGALPFALPEGDWALAPGDYDMETAVLGVERLLPAPGSGFGGGANEG